MAAFDRTTGTATELVGKATGNRRLQVKGKAKKAKGTVKRTVNKARRKVNRARTKSRVKRALKK